MPILLVWLVFCCLGDGYVCDQAGCDVVDNCDRNAQCLFDFDQRRYVCKCDEGYDGDGTYCREKGTNKAIQVCSVFPLYELHGLNVY